MNGLLAQNVAVALLVGGALAYLARRAWRRRRAKTAFCDSCPRGAEAANAQPGDALVSIGDPTPHR